MSRLTQLTQLATVAVLAVAALLAGCERPPVESVQRGYRGVGMEVVYNPRTVAEQGPLNQAPESPEPASPDGPKARDIYKNVQVLGDLSVAQFSRHMASITAWVSPKEGCNYCHIGENFADDSKYTKVVARRMIQMTQRVNADWKPHVAATGVTCYTCHRGNPVPANIWFTAAPQDKRANFLGNLNGQNTPSSVVAGSSLPNDPFTPYLSQDKPIRLNSSTALPTGNRTSIQQAEHTFALMTHFSKSLGVNCTYCHNSASFRNWDMSSVQRVTAWYGLRMTAVANRDYVTPLTNVIPAVHSVTGANQYRKGPMGDPYKINCATCHNGQNKPMNGVSMRPIAPALWPASYGPRVLGEGFAPKADPNATATTCNIAFARALTGKTIEFQTASASIRPSSTALLDSLVQIAGRCSNFKMTVEGHTDAVGDAAVNLKLSEARAAAVDSYLTQKGVADEQLTARGFGAMRPLDTTGSAAGNQRNRRIEINVGTAGGQVAAVATRKGA